MRQAYLEIALVYLQSSGLIALKENNALELVTETQDPETASAKTDSSRKTKSWKVRGRRLSHTHTHTHGGHDR